MSKLLAYNLTGSPLALAAGNTIATLPASASPPDKGPPVNVTSELRGLSGPDYLALQAQIDAGDVSLLWDDVPEYATPGLAQADSHSFDGVVFQEGDPLGSRGRIYVTFAEAHAALGRMGAGPKDLHFSGKFGDPRIPAGTWDMSEVTWRDSGLPGDFFSAGSQILISEGAFLPNLKNIEFSRNPTNIVVESTAGPVVQYTGGSVHLSLGRASGPVLRILAASANSSPFFSFDGVGFCGFKIGAFCGFGNQTGTPSAMVDPVLAPIIEIKNGSFVGLFFDGGNLGPHTLSGDGTVALGYTSSPLQGAHCPDNQPNWTGTFLHWNTESSRTSIVGPSAGPIDAHWNSTVLCDTSGGAVDVNMRSGRHRNGEFIEVKDHAGNALANNVTVNAFSSVVGGTLTYVADAGSGDSAIDGADFFNSGIRPGDSVVVAGTVGQNGTYPIRTVGLTGCTLVGAVLAGAETVASTVTYQELIEGAATAVIAVDDGSVLLRCIGRDSVAVGANGTKETPPEKWFQDNVAASQAAVALGTKVSVTFADIKAIRPGSIVGLSSRVNDDVAAGTMTLTVAINGTPGTLSVVSTAASNASGGESTQAAGIDNFVAGDLLSIDVTTDAGFLPVTTDLEAWLDIQVA